MNRKKNYSILITALTAGLILFATACAPVAVSKESTVKSAEAEPESAPLVMPAGWDDSIIDKIETGQGLKKRIAVLDFEGLEKLEGKAELRLTDLLVTALVATGRFDIVERSRIEQVLLEQDLGLAGIVDEATAAQVGMMLGAEYVILGTVSSATQQNIDKFGYILSVIEVGVDIRAVDAITGRILLSQNAMGQEKSKIVVTSEGTVVSGAIDYGATYAKAARNAIEIAANKVSTLFPLLGYVVSADDLDVVTDIGEERGASAGDSFIVFRSTTEILHPVTGEHLGWNKDVIASIRIHTTEKSLSTGRILSIKGDSFMVIPGDLVISTGR
ncbi:CsgG/HfaB family protein [Candidatus Neomarinimicrobiota bacterium]